LFIVIALGKARRDTLTRVNRSWNDKINRAAHVWWKTINTKRHLSRYSYPMSRIVMSCSYEQLSARPIDKRYSRVQLFHRIVYSEYFFLRDCSISTACDVKQLFLQNKRTSRKFMRKIRLQTIYTHIHTHIHTHTQALFYSLYAVSNINEFRRVQYWKFVFIIVILYRLCVLFSWLNRCLFLYFT